MSNPSHQARAEQIIHEFQRFCNHPTETGSFDQMFAFAVDSLADEAHTAAQAQREADARIVETMVCDTHSHIVQVIRTAPLVMEEEKG